MKFELPPPIPPKRALPPRLQEQQRTNNHPESKVPPPLSRPPTPPRPPPILQSVTSDSPSVSLPEPGPSLPRRLISTRGRRIAVVSGVALILIMIGIQISIIGNVPKPPTALKKEASQTPNPTARPPSWKEVRERPSFAALSPEKQLVTFDRWRLEAIKYASKLADWKDHESDFNGKAAATASALSQAAGDLTPEEARVKIASESLAIEEQKRGAPLTEEQVQELLRAKGNDIYRAYHEWKENGGTSAPAPPSTPTPYLSETNSAPVTVTTQSATPAQPTFRVVNISLGDSLNLRQGPGSNYPTVATLPAGLRGITLGARRFSNGGTIWREVSIAGYAGYVNETYLEAENTSR